MLPRPRVRLPLWGAAAIVVALYLARSAVRGWDFRPDLPVDAIVLGLFLVLVIIVAYVRNVLETQDTDEEPPAENEIPRTPDEASGGSRKDAAD